MMFYLLGLRLRKFHSLKIFSRIGVAGWLVRVKSNLCGLFVSGSGKLKHCKLDCQPATE
jgi:hypothetical protein